MTYRQRIEIDPSVCGGEPVIKGMRVLVTPILSQLLSGESLQTIRQGFPDLTDDDIRAAIELARDSVNRTACQQTSQASLSSDGLELASEWQWIETHTDQLGSYGVSGWL